MIDTNRVFAGDLADRDSSVHERARSGETPEPAASDPMRMRSPLAHSVVMQAPRRGPSPSHATSRETGGDAAASPRRSDWYEVTRDRSDRARSWQPDSARPGPDVDATAIEAPNHGFHQLDHFLGTRVLRLEVTGEDPDALAEAQTMRESLARAGAFASLAIPGSRSFESALGETVRGIYAWAFGSLDSIFLGDSVRPLPRRVADALADHVEVCSIRAPLEKDFADLEEPLAALRAAVTRLGRARA